MKNYVSVKQWIAVLVLTISVVSMMTILGHYKYNNHSINYTDKDFFNISRLENNTDDFHIIIIGNSLIRCGVEFDDILKGKIESQIEISKHKNFKVSRITHGGSDGNDFFPIYEAIEKSKPSLVFIQSEYFNFNYKTNVSNNWFSGFKKEFKRNLLHAFEVFDFKENDKSKYQNYQNSDCQNISKYNLENYQKNLLKRHYKSVSIELKKDKENYVLNQFIEGFKQKQIPVILLEIGRSKVANDHLNFKDEVDKSLNIISDKYAVDVWRFPANLPLDHYADFAHLNAKGRRVFTQWFIKSLEQYIKEND